MSAWLTLSPAGTLTVSTRTVKCAGDHATTEHNSVNFAFVSSIGANVTVEDTSGWPWQSNYNPTCSVSAGGWC